MWLDDYQHIEEAPQVRNITLDERFTESARLSVQGGLKSNFIGDSENQSSAIVVSAVAGVGIGLYFEKSPVLFGIIGSVIGTLLTRISKLKFTTQKSIIPNLNAKMQKCSKVK